MWALVAGRIARPFSSVYDATKHALEAVTDGLRGEMSPFGISVSLIQPGFILTEFLDVANNISRPVDRTCWSLRSLPERVCRNEREGQANCGASG